MDAILQDRLLRVLRFPTMPNMDVNGKTVVQSYRVIDLGTIERPRGNEPYVVTFDGKFLGPSRSVFSFVRNWQDPNDLIRGLDLWRQFRHRLLLTVTDTPVNVDVYISDFTYRPVGGYGDFDFKLEMRQWRDFAVYAEPERFPGLEATATGDITVSLLDGLVPDTTTLEGGGDRPDPGPPESYAVLDEDSQKSETALWDLSLKLYGDGSRWPDLYFANQDAIGPDSNILPSGIVLIVPP